MQDGWGQPNESKIHLDVKTSLLIINALTDLFYEWNQYDGFPILLFAVQVCLEVCRVKLYNGRLLWDHQFLEEIVVKRSCIIIYEITFCHVAGSKKLFLISDPMFHALEMSVISYHQAKPILYLDHYKFGATKWKLFFFSNYWCPNIY